MKRRRGGAEERGGRFTTAAAAPFAVTASSLPAVLMILLTLFACCTSGSNPMITSSLSSSSLSIGPSWHYHQQHQVQSLFLQMQRRSCYVSCWASPQKSKTDRDGEDHVERKDTSPIPPPAGRGPFKFSKEDISGIEDRQEGEEETALPTPFKFSPPMTLRKFMTMQKKRVVVVISYTGGTGYKDICQAAAQLIKERFPDVVMQKKILDAGSGGKHRAAFDITVDDKIVYQKRREKRVKGVFLDFSVIEEAIRQARKRKRPTGIVYGDSSTFNRTDVSATSGNESSTGDSDNDDVTSSTANDHHNDSGSTTLQ